MNIIINNFVQGGFYVGTYKDYDSDTEIRSDIITCNLPQSITVDTPYKWSFVCFDSNKSFKKIDASSGYKDGGTVIDLSSYTWIRYIRIELHDANGIVPDGKTCTLIADYKWIVGSDGYPINKLFPELPELMKKPYPKALWRIEKSRNNGLPFHELLPDIHVTLGAFQDVTTLGQVSIPQSVKKIGEFAFAGTALKKVRIAVDCEYFPTSFPEDCVIEFYGQEVT